MNKEEDILRTGKLFWFKSNRRGEAEILVDYLTDLQKKKLRMGLASNKYEQSNPYSIFTNHYMWFDNKRGYFLVTDIDISLRIKRKISSPKPVVEKFLYKINLSDINRLQNELKSGELDELEIKKILSSTPWKPWLEKEWKTNRDRLIKTLCENCGRNEKLILQHTIQPRRINTIELKLVKEREEDFQLYAKINRNNIQLTFAENIKKVPVCPKCGSSKVNLRTRGENKGTYVCKKSSNYMICKHKFTTPDYGYDENDIIEAEKNRELILRKMFSEKEGLLRLAAEKSLEEIITYLNCDHTKTLCNKCAYKEDRPFDKYY